MHQYTPTTVIELKDVKSPPIESHDRLYVIVNTTNNEGKAFGALTIFILGIQ